MEDRLQRDTRLHIGILEQTPRELKEVEKRIAVKKKAKQRELDAIRNQRLSTEIETLQRLLMMIRMHDGGEALDALAY